MSRKRKKITVLLAQEEFDRFDHFCQARGFKKSTLLVRLIREFMYAKNSTDDEGLQPFDEGIAKKRSL